MVRKRRFNNSCLHLVHASPCHLPALEHLEHRNLLTVASIDLADLLPANGGDGSQGVVINGIAAGDLSGLTVRIVSDVNGDGFDDLAIGAPGADPAGVNSAGEIYVIFGHADGYAATLELTSLDGTNGFVLRGTDTLDQTGAPISSAGDLNGDGFGDIIVGARSAVSGSPDTAGESFVVFGKAGGFSAATNLASLDGTNGFTIKGIQINDFAGANVGGEGDFNGDGFDDLVIGGTSVDSGGDIDSGATYLLFGHAGPYAAILNLFSLNGSNGFVLEGINASDFSGASAKFAGDINGDGFDDLVIGASYADPDGRTDAGESYVVFGHAGSFLPTFDLAVLDGSNGFVVEGINASDETARPGSGGDVNGDGFDDLVFGSIEASPGGNTRAGEAYVIFGKASGFVARLDLTTLDGSNGFRLTGINAIDQAGFATSCAGDLNGDGFDDVVVGSRSFFTGDPGCVWVVFGKAAGFSASMSLASLDGSNGFVLNDIDPDDRAGRTVASRGDVNGDGFDDLLIGAYLGDPGGRTSAGESYLVFGGDFTGSTTHQGDSIANLLTGTVARDVIVAAQGDDTLLGGGGNDVLRGGEGNDRIRIDDTSFAEVSGGTGIDTLEIGSFDLDLTLIANNRIAGIEQIDLATTSGGQTLNLTVFEVLNLSDLSNELVVLRQQGLDTVNIGSGWAISGIDTRAGRRFHVYTAGEATLLVEFRADAGGPYTVGEGEGLNLTGAGSVGGTFTWDLNGDAVFGDATGATPTLSWAQLQALGIADGPDTFNVSLRVTDSHGTIDSTTSIVLENRSPAASLAGAQVTHVGVSQTYTFSATDPAAADQAAGFTFDVDWDGNGTFDQTASGLSGAVQLSHTFNTAGTYQVGVRATDKDGGVSNTFTLPVHVWRVAQAGANVEWEGSGGDDSVQFIETGANSVEVHTLKIGGFTTNFVHSYSGVTGRVIGKGNAGIDSLNASALTNIPATLEGGRHSDTIIGGGADDILRGEFVGAHGDGAEGSDSITGGGGNDLIEGDGLEGGRDTIRGGTGNDTILGDGSDGAEGRADSLFGDDGNDQIFGHHGNDVIDGGNDNDLITGGDGGEANDTITGGAGNDILSGASGKDSLTGGTGLDLLIGGIGLDTLKGDGGEDLLVSDKTNFDLNAAALLAIHNEWTSAASYATRIAHLTGTAGGLNGSTFLIPGTTVFDDEEIDQLTGGSVDLDWFIYDLLQDVLTDHAAGETETDTAGFLPP